VSGGAEMDYHNGASRGSQVLQQRRSSDALLLLRLFSLTIATEGDHPAHGPLPEHGNIRRASLLPIDGWRNVLAS
jgi:hypothetical protein